MKLFIATMIFAALPLTAFAGSCEMVKDGAKSPYNCEPLVGVGVDKKSVKALNEKCPSLGLNTQIFSGAVQACASADCKGAYIVCSE